MFHIHDEMQISMLTGDQQQGTGQEFQLVKLRVLNKFQTQNILWPSALAFSSDGERDF